MTNPAGSLGDELQAVVAVWSRSQRELVFLSARFAASDEWVRAGSPTAAHWIATAADVETSTAREWIRVGRKLAELPLTAAAFRSGQVSYTKVRALTRIATPETEAELLQIAARTSAGRLGQVLSAWLTGRADPDELAAHQHAARSVTWRHEPDGMVVFTLRLAPLVAGMLIAALGALVLKAVPRRRGTDHATKLERPSLAQQRADALEELLQKGSPTMSTEVVVHVRADGATLDDGTPVAGSVVEQVAPAAFIRALVHDAEGRPINASGRQRHPTARQKRVVRERDRVCCDCGSVDLLQYDHEPPFDETQRTVVHELELRCAPCHRRRHRAAG